MHAGVRRMPAERTRHAKHLGRAQVLAADANASSTAATTTAPQQSATSATSTTSSKTTSTSTSASQPSSSAPSLSSSAQSSSAPSSATTASTSSVPSSAGTQSSTVTTPFSSPIILPTTLTSTPPTSSTSTPQTNVAAATNNGLSGGAIAGIVAGAVVVGVALIVFFVRKTYLRRRERKHIISWNGAPGLDEPKPLPDANEPPASFTAPTNAPQRGATLSPFETHGQPMYSTPVPPVVHMRPTIPTYAVPTPPPATYNNPPSVAAYPTQPIPSTYNPGNTTALAMAHVAAGTGIPSALPSARAQHAPVEALVKCTFVPTLPDELSITAGERIFIVEQYDDGWDLCANRRGERGMVPHECLERTPSDQPDIGWRNVQRLSSLNPDGGRL